MIREICNGKRLRLLNKRTEQNDGEKEASAEARRQK